LKRGKKVPTFFNSLLYLEIQTQLPVCDLIFKVK
jgi:hypothetical protein